jgi:translation initiation factor 3 subunit J
MAGWDDSDEEGGWESNLSEQLTQKTTVAADEEEEDMAIVEAARDEALQNAELKTKGKALEAKKAKEADRKYEEEATRKAMEMEADMDANMTVGERRLKERQREEEEAMDQTNDMFGGIGDGKRTVVDGKDTGVLVLKDLKDHLKHARKIGGEVKKHKKVHLTAAFLKELINECKDVLDDDSITEIIKACNVIKNDKLTAAKKTVKGAASKAKKKDKAAEAKAKKITNEMYGGTDEYDNVDAMAHAYEDDFF